MISAVAIFPAAADVLGEAADFPVRRGQPAEAFLRLVSSGRVDGLNGEISYDPALLLNPRVAAGPGAAGFTALGHEVEPGRYRFVLFNPEADAPLNVALPVLRFQFDTPFSNTVSRAVEVRFADQGPARAAAARVVEGADPSVISVGVTGGENVSFLPFTITIGGNAVARWEWYR